MAKTIKCEDDNFVVQSNDENEVIDFAMQHMRKMHPEEKISRDDLQGKMQEV